MIAFVKPNDFLAKTDTLFAKVYCLKYIFIKKTKIVMSKEQIKGIPIKFSGGYLKSHFIINHKIKRNNSC